ncbi:uncharacterized protein TNIN_396331 [Trichonephila inaurata madagascariensis]|uniref:Ig-like V-type domain-containing protein FAM187A n=1 Tax=Trichonephila inaurata madagascariensis TaxID=2747483 RepID=A0A8X6IE15_9ARAC|nr:uncharacterized protein TNIN_396331 [Trichonephila inaurata madagascariensis]
MPITKQFGRETRGIQHEPVAKRTDETYGKCLQKGSGLKEPEAVLLTEGNRLHLTCQLCLNPKVNALGVWKRLLPDTATFVPVKLDGRRSRILTDLSLEIVHIREKDSGIYFCFSDSRVLAKYAVDVVKKEPHRYIIMKGKRKGKGPSQDILLNEFNLVIGWKWSEWSECNRCQSVGRRRRVGICTLKKIDPSSPAKPVDTQILKEYTKGIPCRSKLLPEAIRNLTVIQNTKSEFMVGFCKIPCPSEASIVLITDKTGAVVDAVDNSKGIFSMHQPLPNLPALAKRITLYEEVESSIIVTCPG